MEWEHQVGKKECLDPWLQTKVVYFPLEGYREGDWDHQVQLVVEVFQIEYEKDLTMELDLQMWALLFYLSKSFQ